MKRAVVIVVVQIIRAGIVRDVEIGPAVVIVIAPDHAEAVILAGVAHAGLLRDFFERAIAAIVIEQVRLAGHAPGAALHHDAAEPAGAEGAGIFTSTCT